MKKHPFSLSILTLGFIIFGLILGGTTLFSGHVLAATTGDDFNDNVKDTIKWSLDYFHGNGILKEKNRRLEYAVPVLYGSSYDLVIRDFLPSQGPYTTTWETQIDLFNDTKPSGKNYASMGIEVYKCDNLDNLLYVEMYAHKGAKGFYAKLLIDDTYVDKDTFDLSNGGSLAGSTLISFEPITKTFTLSYNIGSGWITFGSFGVSSLGEAPTATPIGS